MGMSLLEASRGRPKCCEARFAGSVEGMERLFSDCRRTSEWIAELRSVHERLRNIAAQVLSGWQELWRRINDAISDEVKARVEGWKEGYRQLESIDGQFEKMILSVTLDWGARMIFCLSWELERTRAQGNDAMEKAYNNGEIPWQCLNVR